MEVILLETESEEKLPKEEEEKMGSESKDVEEREETKRDVSATAELTSDGRYKCRTCGQVFDTLEEHNEHHRMMHWQPEEQMPREGKHDEPSMPM